MPATRINKKTLWVFLITIAATVAVTALLVNIFEHKQEARSACFRVVEVTDDMYTYYEDVKHVDSVHKETGAPVLKAQHPEFEVHSMGIHARSGVACADCHMPCKREGGMKISDHQVRSPMLNINRACQGCHRFAETETKDRVEQIQVRFPEARNLAMDALMELIEGIRKAREAGATDAQIKDAWAAQRKGHCPRRGTEGARPSPRRDSEGPALPARPA
jgi:formate-dependent nitrite reductase cytochrome c552 subunit